MTEWIKNNYIEIIGAFFALIYLILEVRQKWTMWIVGIISSLFYIYIFFEAKLYAEMGLNVYYTFMSIYGLYCWKLAKNTEKMDPSRITFKAGGIITFISIVLFAAMVFILIRFTDSPVPYADALVAALSIVATWMVSQKIIEHWYIWIFVNFFSVGLYVYQALYPTAVLFMIYGSMSIVGLIQWRKSIKKNQ